MKEVINLSGEKELVQEDTLVKTKNGVHYLLTQEELDAIAARATADKAELDAYVANEKYKADRQRAYNPIGDQLDAIWKQLNQDRLNGKDLIADADAQLSDWLSVKAQFPKPEGK